MPHRLPIVRLQHRAPNRLRFQRVRPRDLPSPVGHKLLHQRQEEDCAPSQLHLPPLLHHPRTLCNAQALRRLVNDVRDRSNPADLHMQAWTTLLNDSAFNTRRSSWRLPGFMPGNAAMEQERANGSIMSVRTSLLPVWIHADLEFADYIPPYLHPDTQVALRIEMEKMRSSSDVEGYIYTFEIRGSYQLSFSPQLHSQQSPRSH